MGGAEGSRQEGRDGKKIKGTIHFAANYQISKGEQPWETRSG